ncbi:MAG: hypothetical protein JW861_10070 [Bacteroidales bacterium]|nr:hypothetical protein [Bacteroidales bacterium]
MKRSVQLLFLLFFISGSLFSQPPQALKYQAVVRNHLGNIMMNQAVGVRLTVRNLSPGGATVYSEIHSTITNAQGVLNIEVGNGTPVQGVFSDIQWDNGSKFLQIEIDPAGGTSYINFGTSQLLSVPYALFAGTDGDWITSGTDMYSANSGNVGIGLTVPAEKFEVAGNISIPYFSGGKLRLGRYGMTGGNDQNSIIEATAPAGYTGGLLFRVWDGTVMKNRMIIEYSGEVGIGTDNPLAKLHVDGGSGQGIYGTSSTSYGIVGESSGSYYAGVQGRAINANAIGLYGHNQYGGTALRAFSLGGLAGHFEGNVYMEDDLGIGITSPSYSRLHIGGTGIYDALIRLDNQGTGGSDFFMGPTNDSWTAGGGKLVIGHGLPSSAAAALTIDDQKRIGIGTFSPQNLLEVNGTTQIGTASKGIRMRNTGAIVDIESLGVNLAINYQTGYHTVMNVTSGNVGIGTANPTYKLHVANSGTAIYASSTSGNAVYATGTNNIGVYASSVSGKGIFAQSSYDYAGWFSGNVHVTGTLSKGGGSFVIDHPLDPENRLLRHNFVESPENLLIYRGKVKLNSAGEAVVVMPDYFAALTDEAGASIHTTPVGKPFLTGCEWQSGYVSFIVYGEPGRDVYWEVLADRDDPVIRELGRPVEEEKGNGNTLCEKGELLYPEAFGYPASAGRDYQMIHKNIFSN